MTQLAGSDCRVCGDPISSILDGDFCPECANPVHNICEYLSSYPA